MRMLAIEGGDLRGLILDPASERTDPPPPHTHVNALMHWQS